MKIYYEHILVGEVMTSHSMTVDRALELIDFDEQAFCAAHGFDDIDYNGFEMDWYDNEPEQKFYLHCPRGFANELKLYGSNDKGVQEWLVNRLDDGMAGTLEEVDEQQAKQAYYFNSNVWQFIDYVENIDTFAPTWETAVKWLNESAVNYKSQFDNVD